MPDEVKTQEIPEQEITAPVESREVAVPQKEKPPLEAGADIQAIVPRTVEQVFRLAEGIFDAGLAPDSYTKESGRDLPKKEAVARIGIGLMKSLECGFPPITGLSVIAIINGRPCIWGDGAVALCQSRGLVKDVEPHYEGAENPSDKEPSIADFPDTYAAVYRIWRKGQDKPYIGRFSVRDAKRAHLWGNQKRVPWIQYPSRMLMNRARAFALRDGFADCLSGLSIREEIEDLPSAPSQTDTSFLDDAPTETKLIEHEEVTDLAS